MASNPSSTFGSYLDLLFQATSNQPRNPPSSQGYATAPSLGEFRYRTPPSEHNESVVDMIRGWLDNQRRATRTFGHTRKYRSLDKDPFCTDASFFGSGRFRPTAYCPRDRSQAPHFVPRREPRRGPYTGAARPEGPRVFRKFGDNTRARVMPFRRYTHMDQSGYDDDVVGSERLPSFLNPHAALGQSGSEAVLTAAGLQRTLGPGRPGSKHYLLDG